MPVPGPENSRVRAALCTLHNELHGKRELVPGYLERVR